MTLRIAIVTLCLLSHMAFASPARRQPTPKTLDEALDRLCQRIDPAFLEFKEKIKRQPVEDIVLYSRWLYPLPFHSDEIGLSSNGILNDYFHRLGIDPEDMFDIVMRSLWRRIHNEPIHLEEQVAHYKASYEKDKQAQELARQEERSALERLRMAKRNIRMSKSKALQVNLPVRRYQDGVAASDLLPWGAGIVVASIRSFYNQPVPIVAHFWVEDQTLRRLLVRGLSQIESITSLKDRLYVTGRDKDRRLLIELGPAGRRELSLPTTLANASWVKLGAWDQHILALAPDTLFVMDGDSWSQVRRIAPALSFPPIPPRVIGSQIFVLQEILGAWDSDLLIGNLRDEAPLKNAWDMLELRGRKWMILDFGPDKEGGFWMTAERILMGAEDNYAGDDLYLFRDGKLEVLAYSGKPRGMPTKPAVVIPHARDDRTILARTGLFEQHGDVITARVTFARTIQQVGEYTYRFEPRKMLEISPNRYLIGETFEGLHVLEVDASGVFHMHTLDDVEDLNRLPAKEL